MMTDMVMRTFPMHEPGPLSAMISKGERVAVFFGGRGDVHVHSNTRLASRRDISFCRLEDFSLGCTFLLPDIGCRMTRILLRPTGSSTYSSCSRTGVHLWC